MDKGNKKEKIIIKLICLLLSFGLWIYVTNVENPIQTYTLKNVPVKLTNTEHLKDYDLAIAPNQNFTVDLKLEGDANQLYSVNKDQFNLVADLGEYALKKGENNVPIEIKDMPSNINVKSDKTQSIKIILESYETKKFKVTSNVNVNFANGVYKDSVTPTEQTVTVSGPESAVNSVSAVSMIGEVNEVNENMTKNFGLQPLNEDGNLVKGVSLNDTQGTLNIKVSKGKVVNIDPDYTGHLPDGYSLSKSELSKSTVQVFGENKDLEAISSIKTEKIDLSNITSDVSKKVNLVIPPNVKVSQNTVNINLGVTKEEPKTKELNISVNYTGLGEGLTLTNQGTTTKVVIQGLDSYINTVGEKDLTATVDLSSYKDSGTFDIEPVVKLVTENKNITIKTVDKVSFTVNKPDKEKEVSSEPKR